MAAYSYDFFSFNKIEDNNILPKNIKNHFEFSSKQVIQGTTGILFTRRKTGFAITAKGTSPAYHGHHIIAFRGTVFECKQDVITDIYLAPAYGGLKKLARLARDAISQHM